MQKMIIQTLVVAPSPNPSILALCPAEEFEERKTCRVVPIWMGALEAAQLGVALEATRVGRPLTHDLMLDALTNLDTTVDRVEIVDVKGQVFYAHLILRCGNRIITLDARPSDAIALAIRQDAPLYMAEGVLDAASYPFIFSTDVTNEKELEEFREFVQSLSPEDFLEE